MSFLDFTGIVNEIDNIFYFYMKSGKTPLAYSSPTEILNPVLDSTFKFIFLQNEEITKNFLNSLNFLGEDEIKDLKFIRNEFPMLTGGRYGKDIKKIDVGVLCTLGKKDNKEKFISLNKDEKNITTIIIDIEMQLDYEIVDNEDYSKRFIGYANQIYASEKVDKVYVIALILNPKKPSEGKSKSSKTLLTESSIPKFAKIKEYDFMTIIKIDLNYCYKLLGENKGIWILNSNSLLNKEGEEWIKYLAIPLWCNSSDNGNYQFPNLLEKNFFANKYVRQALLILANKNNNAFKKYGDELSLFEKDKKIIEMQDKWLETKEELSEVTGKLSETTGKLSEATVKLSETTEELESLKEKYNKIKEDFEKLKQKKQIVKYPKSKSSKIKKKNNKSSGIKKKYKYPKDEIIEEENESDGGEENDEEEGEKEREEEEDEGEGDGKESRDSDYYPDKKDLEEEEKEEGDKDNDDDNKEKNDDSYMDIE